MASHNQWSGGQYLNTTEGFEIRMGGILSVSNEYSTLGKTSIKSTPDNQNKCSLDFKHVITNTDIGKQAIFDFDTYSSKNTVASLYYRLNSNAGSGVILNTINVPGNITTHVHFELDEIVENTYSVCFRVSSSQVQPVYVDNIRLNIQ